jgi:hypothetical protein
MRQDQIRLPYRIRYIADLDSRFIDNEIEPGREEMSRRAEWFARLEASILREGFRNPVVLSAHQTATELALTPRYGGSRIWVAQRHGLRLPAIVADFDGCFPESPRIAPNVLPALFRDPPRKIILKDHGINISGCADSHMVEEDP